MSQVLTSSPFSIVYATDIVMRHALACIQLGNYSDFAKVLF